MGYHDVTSRMPVHFTNVVISARTQFDGSYIFQAEHFTVGERFDDHVFIVHLIFVATAVLQYILECILGFGSQCTGSGFHVLFVKHGAYV